MKLVPYILAGYPSLDKTIDILKIFEEFDFIPFVEVGIPFSDPLADGPVIQRAHSFVLEKKIVNTKSIISYLSPYSFRFSIYFMSYLNPIMQYPGGIDRFIEDIKTMETEVNGLIIPDLPLEEWDNVDIDFPKIPFLAPNSPAGAIDKINRINPPWVYYITRYGTTGEKDSIPFLDKLREFKDRLEVPLYAGFGISKREQIRVLSKLVDGVIVGSLFVKIIEEDPIDCEAKIKRIIEKDFGGLFF